MDKPESIGLIPAGGSASRISPLPCSKEIFPIGFGDFSPGMGMRPKVAAHYLLESIHIAKASKAFIIIKKEKWDIPAYFGNGTLVSLPIGYLIVELTYGVPFTLDCAFPFIENQLILFGFPDIIFQPKDAFLCLIDRLQGKKADIVLGLFKATNPHKMDMVELTNKNRISAIHVKPYQTELKYTWIIAVWGPSFTNFMHEFIISYKGTIENGAKPRESRFPELHIGDVINASLQRGFKAEKVIFEEGCYIDIGTPEDMLIASKELSNFKQS